MKDTIVHFIGFVTDLAWDEFAKEWEGYSQKLDTKKSQATLLQLAADTKNKFRYISYQVWPEPDFPYAFTQRPSKPSPEYKIRVVKAGGYLLQEPIKRNGSAISNCRLLAFVSHQENDIEFYKQLPFYTSLLIHQAYFENCTFGYVLEFAVAKTDADNLLQLLNQHLGVEAGIYTLPVSAGLRRVPSPFPK